MFPSAASILISACCNRWFVASSELISALRDIAPSRASILISACLNLSPKAFTVVSSAFSLIAAFAPSISASACVIRMVRDSSASSLVLDCPMFTRGTRYSELIVSSISSRIPVIVLSFQSFPPALRLCISTCTERTMLRLPKISTRFMYEFEYPCESVLY